MPNNAGVLAEACGLWVIAIVGLLYVLGAAVAGVSTYLGKRIDLRKREHEHSWRELERGRKEVVAGRAQIEQDRQAVEVLAREKCAGFPWLAQAYSDYFCLRESHEAERLERKDHPAMKAAEKVREIAKARRSIERRLRTVMGVCKYWVSLFPFLEDMLGDIDDETLKRILDQRIEHPITELADLDVDPVVILSRLPKEEYEQLSPAERNQLALDNYWTRRKTLWEVGRDYERYIGHLYETQGYRVFYQGILKRYEDLGRDLIANRGRTTLVIQCKRWSRHKRINENHVCQLFGTMVKYRIEHPGERIRAVLYTANALTPMALDFAKALRVELHESFAFEQYPSIKCNVSPKDGSRIYHLPFDQQYDRTAIGVLPGECYVATTWEAELLGFRRAWRWRGNADSE